MVVIILSKYKTMSLEELFKELDKHQYREFHIHHTWKPTHKDFNGSNHIQLVENMAYYHINTLKWSDIGQHITLMPDGVVVSGRDFGKYPASITGRNKGAFAMEMLGNFDIQGAKTSTYNDRGYDKFEGKQKESALKIAKYFLDRGINIVFHNEYSTKTCPGNGINKNKFLEEVRGLNMIFKDMQSVPKWAEEDVLLAHKLGLVKGDEQGYLRPDEPLTRLEGIILLVRLYRLMKGGN